MTMRSRRRRPTTTHARTAAALVAVVLLAAACSSTGDGETKGAGTTTPTTSASTARPVIDPGDGGQYHPRLRPADFVERIDNPYLPMPVGARWVYEGRGDGEPERNTVTVTADRRQILGIPAVVVHDVVMTGGEVTEDTYDWYAQDRRGNVWYLGEDTRELEHGRTTSTKGSWEAGVDGAQPGIVMPAHPTVGQAYRQEMLRGEAEDMGEVVATGVTRRIGNTTYDGLVVTREWTPLEPDVVEEKTYADGIGLVLDRTVRGGDDRSVLATKPSGL